jgi:hypothetical protein
LAGHDLARRVHARRRKRRQGLGCEWLRCFVLHTSGESELLQTLQPATDKSKIRQMSFCIESPNKTRGENP